MNYMHVIAILLVVWNLIVFALYAIDKHKARNGARRISEKTLLACTFLLGAAGALLGGLLAGISAHWLFVMVVLLLQAVSCPTTGWPHASALSSMVGKRRLLSR